MRGDILLTRAYHKKSAQKISKVLIPKILSTPTKYAISICGESGSGKTEITEELYKILVKNNIKTISLHQDDYFRHPPKTNHNLRRKDLSLVGPSEVKLHLLNNNIKRFKDPRTVKFQKPLVYFNKNRIGKETLKCHNAKVILVDGTYTGFLKHIDKKIFLARAYKDTARTRALRKRDTLDDSTDKILAIEHKIISQQKKLADIIVEKDYKVKFRAKLKTKKHIKRICMLSVHGYISAAPTLGKTDTGGQVTYVLELSKALAQKGVKVDIYTRQFQGKRNIEYVSRNVRIVRIPCGGKKFIPKEKILPFLDTFIKNMEKFIKKERLNYDIIHSHYWDAGYVAMKLSERANYFFVHTFHSLGAWKKELMGGNPEKMEKLYRFRQRIKHEKAIFKKVKGLVMTSPEMINISKRFYNYTGKNHVVLPAGVNTSFFRPLKNNEQNKKIDVPKNYIFWVGRFDTNKGLLYLLRGFTKTIQKAKDLFLVIGGGSQNPKSTEKRLKTELKKFITAHHIKNHIFFTRHIKDDLMTSYYRKAKFFVLPSKFEPFGMTAAEAMACGTPLIVSSKAGIIKYLRNKHNCIVVNPANSQELSDSFLALNRDQNLREKIAKNGLSIAKNEFSWQKIAEKSLLFYSTLSK
ncbi:MAG: glycosyltransferase [Candidatus Omnitrophota bacterium]